MEAERRPDANRNARESPRRSKHNRRRGIGPRRSAAHFKAELTCENSWLRRVPSAVKPPMIATAINEAIRAYSMAVAPESLRIKDLMCMVIEFAPQRRKGVSLYSLFAQ